MLRRVSTIILTFSLFATVLAHAQSEAGSEAEPNEGQGHNLSVDVWAAAAKADERLAADTLSTGFVRSALEAMRAMKQMQAKVAFSIEHGYPVSEFSIMCERDQIAEAISTTALSVLTDADRAAFQQLNARNQILREWSDWLIEAHQTMHLGDYYMSNTGMSNNDLFQKLDHCSQSLNAMLVSGRVEEDYTCR